MRKFFRPNLSVLPSQWRMRQHISAVANLSAFPPCALQLRQLPRAALHCRTDIRQGAAAHAVVLVLQYYSISSITRVVLVSVLLHCWGVGWYMAGLGSTENGVLLAVLWYCNGPRFLQTRRHETACGICSLISVYSALKTHYCSYQRWYSWQPYALSLH
jgi:hypothetical protein